MKEYSEDLLNIHIFGKISSGSVWHFVFVFFTPVDAFRTKTQFSDVCIQLGGECVFIAKKNN
jgi:hypothetical protein